MADPYPQRRAEYEDLRRRIIGLWEAGYSAGWIAGEVGKTRSAVMGHLSRAWAKGLTKRKGRVTDAMAAGTIERRARKVRKVAPRLQGVLDKRAVARAAMADIHSRPAQPLPFLEWALPSGRVVQWHQDDGCAFPLGEDAGAPRWCNAAAMKDEVYCWHHFRLTHTHLERRPHFVLKDF